MCARRCKAAIPSRGCETLGLSRRSEEAPLTVRNTRPNSSLLFLAFLFASLLAATLYHRRRTPHVSVLHQPFTHVDWALYSPRAVRLPGPGGLASEGARWHDAERPAEDTGKL